MKVIQTTYDGYTFRSRLEAKWAVFLNELFWAWEYEKEGFVLDSGVPYLPDFYIKKLDTWIEVKAGEFTNEEKEKCRLLSIGHPHATVMLVSGLPNRIAYPCYCNGQLMTATLTTYIRAKGWTNPYFGGNWWAGDDEAFEVCRSAKFEFGKKGVV